MASAPDPTKTCIAPVFLDLRFLIPCPQQKQQPHQTASVFEFPVPVVNMDITTRLLADPILRSIRQNAPEGCTLAVTTEGRVLSSVECHPSPFYCQAPETTWNFLCSAGRALLDKLHSVITTNAESFDASAGCSHPIGSFAQSSPALTSRGEVNDVVEAIIEEFKRETLVITSDRATWRQEVATISSPEPYRDISGECAVYSDHPHLSEVGIPCLLARLERRPRGPIALTAPNDATTTINPFANQEDDFALTLYRQEYLLLAADIEWLVILHNFRRVKGFSTVGQLVPKNNPELPVYWTTLRGIDCLVY